MPHCLNCNKEFVDKKHPDKKYCCPDCFNQSRIINIIKQCLNCGEDFAVKPATQDRKFCSQTCSNRYNQPKDPNKKATFICEWCHREFEEWRYRNRRFCSARCSNKYAARQPKPNLRKPESFITKNCIICDKPYTVHECQIRLRDSKYCSKECKNESQSRKVSAGNNPNWQGGIYISDYGPDWERQKRKAKKRDNHTCQSCGYKSGGNRFLDVHHIIPFRLFDNHKSANQLDNLISLCRVCHAKVEHQLRLALPA